MMDDTQYDKKFTNRNRIIVPNEWIWITVPIKKEQKFQLNKSIEINNNLDWKKTHWQKIQRSYSNAKFFNMYKDYFDSLYKKEWDLLFELNYETLTKTIEWLDLKIEIIKESELNVSGNSTERLVNICKSVGAETYVSGIGGKEYMNENLFTKNKIKLEYQQFLQPEYPQHFSETFIPNLSIIDLLANMGSNSLEFLSGQSVN